MPITGRMCQGCDMLASANAVVDHLLAETDPDYPIDDATIILNCYDEDNDDALVAGPIDVENTPPSNDYYGTISKTATAAMTLGHTIRLEYLIDAGVDRYHRHASWARVVLSTDPLDR